MKVAAWVFGVACWMCASGVLAADIGRPNLSGRVIGTNGVPVPKATVFIYTAGPRKGTGSTCPSCYVDCRKKAQTDEAGRYQIEALDPTLLFRLLVVATGHEPQFVSKVDPAAGTVEVTLKPVDEVAVRSKPYIEGMVIDPDGDAVVGAVISPDGVERAGGTHWGGVDKYVDAVAVTDERGRFLLRCSEDVKTVFAPIEARGVAKRWVNLQPGRDHLVRMQEGVAVSGRVVRDGKPVKDAIVGLVTSDRGCGNFLNNFEAVTDRYGQFMLVNVTPQREFNLFAKMESLRESGALPLKTINTGATGSTIKLGDMTLGPAYRVTGRVVLSDGKPVPPNTRLFLGREDAWDFTEVELGETGDFAFSGVPKEQVNLNVQVKGYVFSKRNPSLDRVNASIVGRVEKDITDLVLLMEPGERRFGSDSDDASNREERPHEKPLRGAKL